MAFSYLFRLIIDKLKMRRLRCILLYVVTLNRINRGSVCINKLKNIKKKWQIPNKRPWQCTCTHFFDMSVFLWRPRFWFCETLIISFHINSSMAIISTLELVLFLSDYGDCIKWGRLPYPTHGFKCEAGFKHSQFVTVRTTRIY